MRRDGAVIIEKLVPLSSIQRSLGDTGEALKRGYGEYKEGDFFEGTPSQDNMPEVFFVDFI